MAGQIKKRGETYTVRVYLGEDPQTGKRKYCNQTVKGTSKDAERALTKMLRDRDTGMLAEPTHTTLDAYLDRWLATAAKPRLRQNTYDDYVYLMKRYVRSRIGKIRLEKLTPLDIQAVLSAMQEQGLSPRTIRYVHTVLNSALVQAVKWRLLPMNPAEHVDKPKSQKKEMQALAPDEVARFLAAAAMDRWGILFAFALATGMRPSEIMGLQWKDVDLKTGTVMVQRALTRGKTGRNLAAPKTPRSRRSIPLPGSTTRQLREHRAAQAEERLAAGAAYVNSDYVFAGTLGQPVGDRSLVESHFKPILEAAGLPKSIRLYDLRHTCATLLLLANEHPKVVSERLGHSTITLTLDTYSHVLPSMQRGAADKLEDMLFGTQG